MEPILAVAPYNGGGVTVHSFAVSTFTLAAFVVGGSFCWWGEWTRISLSVVQVGLQALATGLATFQSSVVSLYFGFRSGYTFFAWLWHFLATKLVWAAFHLWEWFLLCFFGSASYLRRSTETITDECPCEEVPSCIVSEPLKRTFLLQRGLRHHCLGAMALVPGGGPVALPPPAPYHFMLLARGGEWDEVIIMASCGAGREQVVLTTSPDGSEWVWSLIKQKLGSSRAPLVQAAGPVWRLPPPGVAANTVNWVCDPATGNFIAPDDPMLTAYQVEAMQVAEVMASRDNADVVFEAGSNVAFIPSIGKPGSALNAALFAGVPGGIPAPPAVGGALAPGAVGIGGVAPGAVGAASSFTVQDMERAINEIRTELALADAKSSDKKSKKSKKDEKHKKKKKHRRRSRSNSSDSSSHSSTSSSSEDRVLRWKEDGRNRKVSPKMVSAIEARVFKNKSELIAFATKHPGALSALFLRSVHAKVCQGRISQTKDLRKVSASSWAAAHTGLSELRDQKEVLTLCAAIDAINNRELSQAMDILAQRVQAIQNAKQKNGSWEKASNMELVSSASDSTTSLPLRRLVQ